MFKARSSTVNAFSLKSRYIKNSSGCKYNCTIIYPNYYCTQCDKILKNICNFLDSPVGCWLINKEFAVQN